MTITAVGNYGGLFQTAASAVITWTAQLAITASSGFVVAICAADNSSITDASSNQIPSITGGGGVTWVKVGEWTNAGAGGSALGAVVAAFRARPTADVTVSTLHVVNFSPNSTRRSVTSHVFTSDNDISLAAVMQGQIDAGSLGPLTLAGLPSREYAFFNATAAEESASASFVESVNYATMTKVFDETTLGNGMAIHSAYRILTGTGDTYDPQSGPADQAQLFFALYEVVPGTLVLSASTDALLQKAMQLTASLDGVLQKLMTLTAGTDAKLLHQLQASAVLDAVMQKELSAGTSLDMVLLKQGALITALDGLLKKQMSLTTDVGAVLATQLGLTTTIGANLLEQFALTASVDAKIITVIALNAFLDAAIVAVGGKFVSMDAVLTGSWRRTDPASGIWTPATPQT